MLLCSTGDAAVALAPSTALPDLIGRPKPARGATFSQSLALTCPNMWAQMLQSDHSVGKQMRLTERLKADLICARGALRTLKLTTPIAKNPTRVFPAVIEELAEKYGDRPALLSDRAQCSYRM